MNAFRITLLFILLGITSSYGQKMTVQVEGMPDTTVFLAKYFGKKLYYADTAYAQNSTVTYDLSKHEAGVYALLVPPKNSYFELIITGEEDINIKTKGPNFAGNMDISKSKENQEFYEYIGFMNNKSQAAKVIGEKKNIADDNEKKKLDKQMETIQNDVKKYQDQFFEQNGDLLVAKYLKIMQNIEIPEPPHAVEDTSLWKYHYNVNHFFDNVDLTDDRMVKGPMFANKFDTYFSKNVMIQQPDTIMKYADQIIAQLKDSSEMFKYIVHNITYTFESSEIMGMENVFVHMAQNYYCPPEDTRAFWLTPEKLKEICERADKLSGIITGQKAPYLSLPDSTEENWINFYELPNDYVVLYFWDPECGHCKKVTPKLGETYSDTLKDMGVEVYAIGKAMGEDFEKWKAFIQKHDLQFINVGLTKNVFNQAQENPLPLLKEKTNIESLNYHDTYDIYSTPRVFIVDKERKIIAKGIGVNQIVSFLKRYMKANPANE